MLLRRGSGLRGRLEGGGGSPCDDDDDDDDDGPRFFIVFIGFL